MTSVLNGINDEDGSIIKEYEASHGTVTDMWYAHLRGEETSLNPLSMMEALIGAIIYSAEIDTIRSQNVNKVNNDSLIAFAQKLQKAIHKQVHVVTILA